MQWEAWGLAWPGDLVFPSLLLARFIRTLNFEKFLLRLFSTHQKSLSGIHRGKHRHLYTSGQLLKYIVGSHHQHRRNFTSPSSMSSYPRGSNGPLWGSFSSSTFSPTTPNPPRRPSWATATLATGQSILSAMLYNRKEYDISEHPTHRTEYQSFRDDILMPPAYDSVVAASSQLPPPPAPKSAAPRLQERRLSEQPTATATTTTSQHQQQMLPRNPQHVAAIKLPPLPRLLGLENLDEWDDMLLRTLRLHGLSAYLIAPHPGVPEPLTNDDFNQSWMTSPRNHRRSQSTLTHDQWTANRAAICLLMISSFSTDVRDTLLANGYDGASDEDPRAIHELVLEALPKAAGEDVATWMGELSAITPNEPRFEGSLREFALRLQYLRRRLNQAEPQPNDNLVMVMAVLGLARCERYERLSMSLGRELERGNLSWGRLMADLAGVYGREVRERRTRGKVSDDARS